MLETFFNPKSVAVIGASRKKGSVGYGLLANLLGKQVLGGHFNRPFGGKVYAVNPKAERILGQHCYASITKIRGKVDLAVIAVPARFVPEVVRECVQKKVKAAVIISAGFAEFGEKGHQLQDEILDHARGKMRIIGPNCLGVMRPVTHLNASFAPVMPYQGGVALVSQSGALIDSILDWAVDHNYGMSAVVSVGNQADVTLSDTLEYFGNDQETKCVAMYIENVVNGKRFMDVARRIARKKPILAIKAGRTDVGSKAVSSHTGNLAGSDVVYQAAFAQAGIISVNTIEELLYVSDCVARYPRIKHNGVAIITNGGGCGVLCADMCYEFGVAVPDLTELTKKTLDASGVMHPAYSRSNPLDIVGDALPKRYAAALDGVLRQKNIHGAIVIQTLQTMTDPVGNAQAVVEAAAQFPDKPVVTVFLGGHFTKKGVVYLEKHGIKNFDDVRKAARAMQVLHHI